MITIGLLSAQLFNFSPMKAISHYIQYLFLRALGLILVLLPKRTALWLGTSLGTLAFRLGLRRRVALDNIDLSLASNSQANNRAIVRRLYQNLGANLAELLRFETMTCEQVKQMVTLEGVEHLDRALQEGKGAILVSAHFGNWEMFGAALACYGYPFSVVVYPQHNRPVDRMLNRLRASKGIEVIYKREAAREVLSALRRNRFVTMLSDQDAGPEGLMVNFLGRPASVTRGPAVFALKTGAPVITGVIVRQEGGGHRGYIDRPLYPDLDRNRDSEMIRLTETFTRRLEGYVLRHPDHWYWVHRRWKTRLKAQSI